MAETLTGTQSPSGSDPDYWCYHCEKRVSVETLPDLPDVVCYECKNGFVESIGPVSAVPDSDRIVDDPAFGNQFLQVLRLIGRAARDDDAPPPPPSELADPDPFDEDYLRVQLDGWHNDDDAEEEENDVVIGENRENRSQSEDYDDDEDEEGVNDDDVDVSVDVDESERNENRGGERDEEEDLRRRQRDVLRLRLRDFAARASNRRNRILDWAEILMGLEDNSIDLRFQVPEVDGYIGNPGDYVDPADYEALLETLSESDSNKRQGAPPASKIAIEGLDTMVIKSEQDAMVCAICKDGVELGEIAKKLPCGHGYHGDCIVPWLGSRNSCPVCRFELPTDDPEYEEARMKRGASTTTTMAGSGSSSSTANNYG